VIPWETPAILKARAIATDRKTPVTAILAGLWADKHLAQHVHLQLGWQTLSATQGTTTKTDRRDQAIAGGILNVRCSAGAFSAAMITLEADTPLTNRHHILVTTGHMLADQGVLVIAAERQALNHGQGDRISEALLRRCRLTACWSRDDAILAVFQKQHPPTPVPAAQRHELVHRLRTAGSRVRVSAVVKPPPASTRVWIHAVTVDPQWVEEHAPTSGLWKDDGSFPGQIDPAPTLSPLMPLRKGHLALAITGGVFGTIPVKTAGADLLIKGRHAKRELPERATSDAKISRETFSFAIGVLDLQRHTCRILESGPT
jgi:hypothetical protein